MSLLGPGRLRLSLITGALFTCIAIPAGASYVNSTVFTPQVSTGYVLNGGQLVTTGTMGNNFAEGLTNYSLNKALANSVNSTEMQASSDWVVDFTLSETGKTSGFIPLTVTYSYDANLTLFNTDSFANFSYTLSNGQGTSGFAGTFATTFGSGFNDRCPSRFPMGGDHPPGACAGSYSSGGPATVTINNIFTVGANKLEGLLITSAIDASAAAFNTGKVLSITVPSDASWTYTDLTGNPLNFQNAGSGVPEPATWGFMTLGLAALLFRRMRKA